MSQDSAQILESLPKLVADGDVSTLAGYENHHDKAVRKAVRKALHKLRSRGIVVPETPNATWRAGNELASMRGDVDPAARVDVQTVPGATSLLVVDVGEEGSLLASFVLDGADRVLGCQVYGQTDGQRNRMLQQWHGGTEARRVPVAWARARINWARQRTIARGLPVPPALDQMADRLGETPSERPPTFLADQLAGDVVAAQLPHDQALMRAECHRWPILFAIEPFLDRVGTEYESARSPDSAEKPAPSPERALTEGATPDDGLDEGQRVETLRRAAKGDEAVREALRGPMANLLDDAAIVQWQRREDDVAKLLFDVASALRTSDAPEEHEWAPYLLRFQVSTVAVRMLREQAQRQQSAGAPA